MDVETVSTVLGKAGCVMWLKWNREEPLVLWSGKIERLGVEGRVLRWEDKMLTVEVRDGGELWRPAHVLQTTEVLFTAVENLVLFGLEVK